MAFVKLGAWAIAVVLLVVCSFALSIKLTVPSNAPSSVSADKVLEENFREHELAFNELIKMSQVDPKLIRIADDFTWLDTNVSWPRPESELGFSQERWEQYRQAFRALGLKQGLMRQLDTDTIFLIADSTGAVTSGSSKGYAYSNKPLSPLADSLDNLSPELLSQHTVYKRLSGDWYLFFQGS